MGDGGTSGLCPEPCPKPEVSGLPAMIDRFAINQKGSETEYYFSIDRAAINEVGGAGTSGSCRGVGWNPARFPRIFQPFSRIVSPGGIV